MELNARQFGLLEERTLTRLAEVFSTLSKESERRAEAQIAELRRNIAEDNRAQLAEKIGSFEHRLNQRLDRGTSILNLSQCTD